MAKINLLKQKWVGTRRIERLRLITRVIVLITVGGFLLQTFYVTGRLIYLRSKISKTKSEVGSLSSVLEKSRSLMESYVWAQGVLDKMEVEEKSEYKYKNYLVEINSWLTKGTSLVGVSFTKKDEITFLVFAEGIDDYRAFETNLNLKQEEEGFGFKVVEQESLSRSEDGTYKVKIKLKI